MFNEHLIPHSSDRERLGQLYYESPDKDPNVLSKDFVKRIGNRIYTEWCLDNPKIPHNSYVGEAFTKFVDDETHYLCEREGVSSWDEQWKKRDLTLKALVKCSIDFFKNVDEFDSKDKRNLRCDLSKWL